MRRFDAILVANRGEIACRVMRTAAAAGYRTVAVYSDADAGAPHVGMADEAVHLGPAPAAESYLNIGRVVAAAKRAGAGAIHPGYGFLSENAAFAAACEEAGIVFIGPPAEAIALMGDKASARRRMIEAGVPCLPGYEGSEQSDGTLLAAAGEIGFPIMVKAAAGGGGRGMRLVASAGELGPALQRARAESLAAFGSDRLILERALLRPRHVEVQVLADGHGGCLHLGERDCSVQRRHQKVIEEAPCPVVGAELRARMGAVAVEVAKTIGYRGAGTVEFLLDEAGRFYFMEMNTRLQVEHPVTEMVTGLDLVALQLRVARGEPLGLAQSDVVLAGHAIEARLYAEDPAAGFLPGTGPVEWLSFPEGEGVRVDAGVRSGSEITPFYDPMVAKIVAHGADRDEALARLRRALGRTALFGPACNRDFLIAALGRESFARGEATTAFVAEEFAGGFAPPAEPAMPAVAAVLHHVFATDAAEAAAGSADRALRDWSSSGTGSSRFRFEEDDGGAVDVAVHPLGSARYRVALGDARHEVDLARRDGRSVELRVDGRDRRLLCHAVDARCLHVATAERISRWRNVLGLPRAVGDGAGSGRLLAPMHGVLVDLGVAAGDRVETGDRLAVLEAMKIQHELLADVAGTVAEVHCAAGEQVAAGTLLVEIAPGGVDATASGAAEQAGPLAQALDFRDESEALYRLLEPLTDADFRRRTQFKGWTIDEVLTHLHVWNRAALLGLTDEKALLTFLGRVRTAMITGDLRSFERDQAGGVQGGALRRQWRELCLTVAERFAAADPKRRVKWAGPDMSVRSSITARLMETWAHGQEVYDLLGVQRSDADRIRNIAELGVRTFRWSFANRGLEPPGPPPRVTLAAPSGDTWAWNEDNESERVAGSATEFCQVVTQVRNVADTSLTVEGEAAAAWMAIAQCFAGPPQDPPAPGTRFRAATKTG